MSKRVPRVYVLPEDQESPAGERAKLTALCKQLRGEISQREVGRLALFASIKAAHLALRERKPEAARAILEHALTRTGIGK